MTLQSEILNDSNYIPVLDHGFVGIVDYMGSDNAVVQAARVSYGNGTKTVNEDRGLIRYLVSHKHTSPLEMCEVKFHIKLPIFVMRQLVRHRTSSLNEYSARYSIMTDEMYIPKVENIKPQSSDNKQGRSGEMAESDAQYVQQLMANAAKDTYNLYKELLGPQDEKNNPEGMSHKELCDLGYTEDFSGVAREIARTVLPVAGYTELYWKQDLHNLFHMLRLRIDAHAQWEIQEFGRAIYSLIKPLYPLCCEAFEDYILNAKNLSGMDKNLLKDIMSKSASEGKSVVAIFNEMIAIEGDETKLMNAYRMNKREWKDFKATWSL